MEESFELTIQLKICYFREIPLLLFGLTELWHWTIDTVAVVQVEAKALHLYVQNFHDLVNVYITRAS